MSNVEVVIAEAKRELPQVFTTGGELPYADERMTIGEELFTAESSPVLPRPDSSDGIESLESANKDQGFEAFAFYVSFHNPTPTGEWGIFYWDHATRLLAAKIMRDLKISERGQATRLAFEILRRHELFHYRFDLYALHQELTIGRPLYNEYRQNVYARVLYTPECYEEALANACSACSWKAEISTGLLLGSFGATSFSNALEDFREFLRINSPDLLATPEANTALYVLSGRSLEIERFVVRFCRDAPAGYSDFSCDPARIRSELGGQLLSGSLGSAMPFPQARWVGTSGAFAERLHCPEYVLVSRHVVDSQIFQVLLKSRGDLWLFHKYDQDPWPSKPHGHNRETGEKLHIGTGQIFDRNRRPTRHCNRTELDDMRARLEKLWADTPLPPLQ